MVYRASYPSGATPARARPEWLKYQTPPSQPSAQRFWSNFTATASERSAYLSASATLAMRPPLNLAAGTALIGFDQSTRADKSLPLLSCRGREPEASPAGDCPGCR